MMEPLYYLDENNEVYLTLPSHWLDEFVSIYDDNVNFSNQLHGFLAEKEMLIRIFALSTAEYNRIDRALRLAGRRA